MVDEREYGNRYETESVLRVNDVVTKRSPKPYVCNVSLNGMDMEFEIDTGAGRTLLCEKDYYTILNRGNTTADLDHTNVPTLRAYSGDIIQTIGKVELNVKHNNSTQTLTAIVVKSKGLNLLGRDWLNILKLDWIHVFNVGSNKDMFDSELFTPELGTLKDIKVKINVKADHIPREPLNKLYKEYPLQQCI